MEVTKMGHSLLFLLLLLLVILPPSSLGAARRGHRPPSSYIYQRSADVHFGLLMGMHFSHASGECSSALRKSAFYNLQIARLATDAINADPTILPNLTLGFVAMDTCLNREFALQQVVQGMQPLWAPTPAMPGTRPPTPIFGVIGCERSDCAIGVSGYLQIRQIPLLSFGATAEVLTNKHLHPLFARLLPSARHFGEIIARLLVRLGWDYVALVYENKAAQRDVLLGFDGVRRPRNACRPLRQILHHGEIDMRQIVQDTTRRLRQGNIIVLLTGPKNTAAFLNEMQALGLEQRYVLILADPQHRSISLHTASEDQLAMLDGALSFEMFIHRSALVTKFLQLTYDDVKDNPWAKAYVRETFQCRWSRGSRRKRRRCLQERKTKFRDSTRVTGRPVQTDLSDFLVEAGIRSLAQALHGVVASKCPAYFLTNNVSLLAQCVNGKDIYSQLTSGQKVHLLDDKGQSVDMHFQANGDIASSVSYITQTWVHPYLLSRVGVFSQENNSLVLNKGHMRWPSRLRLHPNRRRVPPSVCSGSCRAGQVRVQKSGCCWRCRTCRPNEIVRRDSCSACPSLQWPNITDRRSCATLKPKGPSVLVITISTIFALLSALVTFLFLVLLFRRRNSKLVRAIQLPLNGLMLLAILLLCLLTFLFLPSPTRPVCFLHQLLFPLAFALLYGAILARALRLFAVMRSRSRPLARLVLPCASGRLQIAAVTAVVTAEVFLSALVLWTTRPPHPVLVMPASSRPEVVRVCALDPLASYLPAAFNALLALLCAGLMLPARALAANCRESLRLFLCAVGTLVLWAVFLSLLTLLDSHGHRRLLYLLVLHFTALLHLACLFLPVLCVGSEPPDLAAVPEEEWNMCSSARMWGAEEAARRGQEDSVIIANTQT